MSGIHPHHRDGEGALRRMIIGSEQDENGLNQPSSPTYIPVNGSQQMQAEAVNSYLNGEIDLRSMRIEDYSFWVAQNWKEAHLTLEAKKRTIKGIQEETFEAVEAMFSYQNDPQNENKRIEVVSELGDYLWYSTQAALLLGVDTQRSLAHYMLDENGEANMTSPISEIDEYYQDGNLPRFTKTLYNEEDTLRDDLNPALVLPALADYLVTGLTLRYGYDDIDELVGLPMAGRDDMTFGKEGYAKAVHFVAYYAKAIASSSLEQVIAKNVDKLTRRVDANKIDKSDGARTEDEL